MPFVHIQLFPYSISYDSGWLLETKGKLNFVYSMFFICVWFDLFFVMLICFIQDEIN